MRSRKKRRVLFKSLMWFGFGGKIEDRRVIDRVPFGRKTGECFVYPPLVLLVSPCVEVLRGEEYVGWLVNKHLLFFLAVTLALVRCEH